MAGIYDLIGMDDPLDGVLRIRRARQAAYPQLPPEVEDSILSQAAGVGLSGLELLGNVLDTPGAFVRTALAGENPFPAIFDTSQRVGGRELLEQYGMLSPNTAGLDMGDVGGFGAEVLLDPLTYMTFGGSALTKLGRGLSMTDDLARASYGAGGALLKGARQAGIEAGERGLIGVGLPFMQSQAIAGTGPWAQKFAGGLDTAEHFLRYGNPVGRTIGGLFDPAVHDATTMAGQVEMKTLDPQLEAAEAAARMQLVEQAQQLRQMGYLQNSPAEAAAFRGYMEGIAPLSQEYAQAQPVLDTLRGMLEQGLIDERALAMQSPELMDDFVNYVPRQRTTFPSQMGSAGRQRAFPTEHPFQGGREEFLKNIPGGTEAINKMSLDPALSGAATKPILDRVTTVKNVYGIADDNQAKDLAEWLGSLPADHLTNNVPVFGNHPVYDILNRFVAGQRSQAAVEGMYGFLGKNLENVRTVDNVPVASVLEGMGLDRGRALYELSQRLPGVDMARAFVPKEIQADVGRFLKAFQSPEPVGMFLGAVDKFTNAFKVSALTRPSRWTRDWYSGQFMNWVTGLFSPRSIMGANDILTKGLDAVVKGAESIPEFAARGLNPQQATQELVSELFAHRVIQPYGGEFADLIGPGVTGSKLLSEIPGGVPQTFKSTLVDPYTQGKFWSERANPSRVRGIGWFGRMSNETQFAPVKMSENISHYTDGLNRISPYIEARLQGMSPAVAARKVKASQVDYSRLTSTERKVMKRVAPFYSFVRRMIPAVFGELMEKPGGRLGQTIRAERLSRDDQFIPPYMSPGLAINLGDQPSGDTRYLTSIDLPHESVLQLFRPAGGNGFWDTLTNTIEQTGLGLAGQTNPLAKAPAELLTGKQFYSGRELSELDSRIGRVIDPKNPPDIPILWDTLAMNTPIVSPVLTTVGTISDPRKSWFDVGVNTLTGTRLSDVDVESARDRAARKAIEDLMEGNPDVRSNTSLYVSPEATLSDDEYLLMSAYNQIRQRARERARNAGAGRL